MKMSTEGLIALVGHEGIVRSRYKDSVGVWTIGVGHTAAAGGLNPAAYSGTLRMDEVIDLLRKDIAKYEAAVAKAVKVPLKQHEFDAVVSWHFNTGAVATASWIKKLNAGDRAGALKGIMDWRKPAEIIPRRTAERDLFKTGVYPPPYANVYPADMNGKVQWGQGYRVNVRNLLTAPAPAEPAKPAPRPPVAGSKPVAPGTAAAAGGIAALLAASAAFFSNLPCQWFGFFCG